MFLPLTMTGCWVTVSPFMFHPRNGRIKMCGSSATTLTFLELKQNSTCIGELSYCSYVFSNNLLVAFLWPPQTQLIDWKWHDFFFGVPQASVLGSQLLFVLLEHVSLKGQCLYRSVVIYGILIQFRNLKPPGTGLLHNNVNISLQTVYSPLPRHMHYIRRAQSTADAPSLIYYSWVPTNSHCTTSPSPSSTVAS